MNEIFRTKMQEMVVMRQKKLIKLGKGLNI